MLYRFLVVFGKAENNYSAYSPDLLGCVAVGDTLEETERNMEGAMRMHIQGMLEDHEPIPVPHSSFTYIEISMPDVAT